MAFSSASSPLGFQPHVLIFPFMAQGHTIPLLDLSKALADRGVQVTIITTPLNVPFITSAVSNHQSLISLSVIPFPKVEGLSEGCENTKDAPSPHHFGAFLKATSLLKKPFENILMNMSELPIAVISDMFLGWTLESCNLFNIPRITFNGMGVFPSFVLKYVFFNFSSFLHLSASATLQLPNLTAPFEFTKADLPNFVALTNPENPIGRMLSDNKLADTKSWGLISNSFEELEGEYISALESSDNNVKEKKVRVWCVGPVLLYDKSHQENESCPYIKWLDEKQRSDSNTNIIYISFGSQAKLTNLELDEIALGLELSGQNFIWVVKSESWVPPEGWAERILEKGMVVRDWVDQRRILSHPATGGFLTHCGWNSVLEGLTAGVPMLPWPVEADQKLNAKYVATGLGIGVSFAPTKESVAVINREMICDGVKRLMVAEEGRNAREKVQELSAVARKSVEKGGSSYEKLGELIECLIARTRMN